VPRQFPGLTITRASDGAPARVAGRLRLSGKRTIDAGIEVPEDGTLADEELVEAALVLLRKDYPGARWADPQAAAATASVTGDRKPAAGLFRFPLYLLLWTVLIAPASYGIEHVFRERVIVPACVQWGRERGVAFGSYSHGGGEWYNAFNLTGSYSAPGCYFTGGYPNFATLREIGGGRLPWIAAFGGPTMVLAGFVITTAIVVLIAFLVETTLRRRPP
jgi:hypothetical protein